MSSLRAVAVSLAILLMGSAPVGRDAAPTELEPLNCKSCLVVYFGGSPVGAACIVGGTTFQDCWVSGITCNGTSCDWAATELEGLLDSYATAGDVPAVLALVSAFPRNAKLSDDGSQVIVTSCAGERLAAIDIARPFAVTAAVGT